MNTQSDGHGITASRPISKLVVIGRESLWTDVARKLDFGRKGNDDGRKIRVGLTLRDTTAFGHCERCD